MAVNIKSFKEKREEKGKVIFVYLYLDLCIAKDSSIEKSFYTVCFH